MNAVPLEPTAPAVNLKISPPVTALVPQQNLAALAAKVRAGIAGAAQAGTTMLNCLVDAGEALIDAKAQIKEQTGHGHWLKWLKSVDLSEDRAENYMRLARGKAHLNSARVRNLSLTQALRLIREAEQADKPNSKPRLQPRFKPTADKKVTSFDALGWWINAPVEERQHFLDGAGSGALSEAMPPSWGLALKTPIQSEAQSKAPPSTITELIVQLGAILTEIEPPTWLGVLSPRDQKKARKRLEYLEDDLHALIELREIAASKLPPVPPAEPSDDGLDLPTFLQRRAA
jgi:hypothetical protein